jgi:outer membrane protein OmpA-like peptidoglycan-associated protein
MNFSYGKNVRKHIFLAILFGAALIYSGCGDEKPQVKQKVDIPKFDLEVANKELAKYPVSGFDYKGSDPSKADFDKKADEMLPYVKSLLQNMPEGYIIEVRGHADKSGPEEPVGKKPGNIKISEERAKSVREALVKKGIPAEKLAARGVGSSETVEDSAESKTGRSKVNRRVTFHVIQK